MLIPLLAAIATGFAIVMFVMYFARAAASRPADLRLKRLVERPEGQRRGLSWKELRRRGPSSLPLLHNVLVDSAYAQRISLQLEQAGLRLRVGEFIIARVGLALITFAGIALLGRSLMTTILAAGAAVVAYFVPRIWLVAMRRRRIDQITRQLPEAVTMIANGMRAGFAFQHGISLVAEQMQPPIADEFARMTVDMNVGASVEDALTSLLKRADSEEMNLLVTAVLIQRSTGGNLAEILETTAEQVREKERLIGEVRTMTSQQRFSGTVMTMWPMFLLGLFCLLNWDTTKLLFTTTAGVLMLGAGGLLQLFGYFTIRRILDVEI